MFELVKELHEGAAVLEKRSPNPISLNAGCQLFIAFVTLFPHDSAVRETNFRYPCITEIDPSERVSPT